MTEHRATPTVVFSDASVKQNIGTELTFDPGVAIVSGAVRDESHAGGIIELDGPILTYSPDVNSQGGSSAITLTDSTGTAHEVTVTFHHVGTSTATVTPRHATPQTYVIEVAAPVLLIGLGAAAWMRRRRGRQTPECQGQ